MFSRRIQGGLDSTIRAEMMLFGANSRPGGMDARSRRLVLCTLCGRQ